MVPIDKTPEDFLEEIRPFVQWHDGRAPLLQPVNLLSERAKQAQEDLAQVLRKHAELPDFKLRFGFDAAAAVRQGRGFQIHQGKLDDELLEVLATTELAWIPGIPQPADREKEYIEV